jgi:uncharacterized protein
MKQRGILLFGSVLLVGLLFLSGTAGAQDIKARMKDRLPIINELKAKGIVGENNRGFLEFVGGQREKPEVVKAENEDRAVVYAAIAKQQGVSAELVGQRRAAQLRELANPGEWLQNEGGEWVKK